MIRKKDILALKPAPVTGMGGRVSAQIMRDLLILCCYQDGELIGRWCMDTGTGRYLTRMEDTGEWSEKKLMSIYGFDPNCYSRYSWHKEDGGVIFDTKESGETVRRMLGKWNVWEKDMFLLIGYCEEQYRSDRRERAEERKQERLERQMKSVPSLPPDLKGWLHKVTGGEDYLFRAKGGKGRWYCTSCGAVLEEGQLGAGEPEEGSVLICGNCKKKIRCMGRKRIVHRQTHCVLFQDMGENESAARHIDVRITWA